MLTVTGIDKRSLPGEGLLVKALTDMIFDLVQQAERL